LSSFTVRNRCSQSSCSFSVSDVLDAAGCIGNLEVTLRRDHPDYLYIGERKAAFKALDTERAGSNKDRSHANVSSHSSIFSSDQISNRLFLSPRRCSSISGTTALRSSTE
jgi:hypothetical protein